MSQNTIASSVQSPDRAGQALVPVSISTADTPSSGRAAVVAVRNTCGIVRQLTGEMILMAGDRVLMRRDRRRTACHARQIAMYVCHVALGVSLSDIGQAFGRDRTTVSHACHVVEDRRDDPGYDEFVSAIERVTSSVFGLAEASARD